jgi:hypothetical protein
MATAGTKITHTKIMHCGHASINQLPWLAWHSPVGTPLPRTALRFRQSDVTCTTSRNVEVITRPLARLPDDDGTFQRRKISVRE